MLHIPVSFWTKAMWDNRGRLNKKTRSYRYRNSQNNDKAEIYSWKDRLYFDWGPGYA